MPDALDTALREIENMFGPKAVQRMGDDDVLPVETISTGAMTLDRALGVGGLGRGTIAEIYGPEGAGKTTLLYHLIANAQVAGGTCAFIDAEHALDPAYAKRVGVSVNELLISQPSYGEEALEIANRLIRSNELALICVDSVAALTPKAELEGQVGDQMIGAMPRMMSQAMRMLTGPTSKAKTLLVFTNQIREKVGVTYGSSETQPGGRALKFYASQRIDVRMIERLKSGDEVTGIRVRAKVVKNKLAPPYQQAEFDIDFGWGVSHEGCLLDLGLQQGLVTKKGSWLYYDKGSLGQGRPQAKEKLRGADEWAAELESAIERGTTDDPSAARDGAGG